jgi:hypothetical protein
VISQIIKNLHMILRYFIEFWVPFLYLEVGMPVEELVFLYMALLLQFGPMKWVIIVGS